MLERTGRPIHTRLAVGVGAALTASFATSLHAIASVDGRTVRWIPTPELVLVLGVGLILSAPLWTAARPSVEAPANTLFIAVYVGWLLGYAIWLQGRADGPLLVIFLVGVTWIGETAPISSDRPIGRHLLAPVLSPRKTLEGAAAQVIASIAAVSGSGRARPACSPAGAAGAGALLGVIGRWAISPNPRSSGASNQGRGRAHPGHGGMLDPDRRIALQRSPRSTFTRCTHGATMKQITLLGATGSIGLRTLDLVELSEEFSVRPGGARVERRADRRPVQEVRAACRWRCSAGARDRLASFSRRRGRAPGRPRGARRPVAGTEGDIVVSAQSAARALRPWRRSRPGGPSPRQQGDAGHGGRLMTARRERRGVKLLPSTPSTAAVFQCLAGQAVATCTILLTASGGRSARRRRRGSPPSRSKTRSSIRRGRWGPRSRSTRRLGWNKGLEIIEARWLFDVAPDQVQVVVHPQSIIHSMVEYIDGSVIAQLGGPTWRAHSLRAHVSERRPTAGARSISRASPADVLRARPGQVPVPQAGAGRAESAGRVGRPETRRTSGGSRLPRRRSDSPIAELIEQAL